MFCTSGEPSIEGDPENIPVSHQRWTRHWCGFSFFANLTPTELVRILGFSRIDTNFEPCRWCGFSDSADLTPISMDFIGADFGEVIDSAPIGEVERSGNPDKVERLRQWT